MATGNPRTKSRRPAKVADARDAADEDADRGADRRLRRPKADPANVVLNSEGFGWRSWLVRLPNAAVADDLKEPSIWSLVQRSGKAFRRHDHLYVVAYDESWAAEVVVADASAEAVDLTGHRIMQLGRRVRRLLDDGVYRVAWTGSGFVVERCTDGVRMTSPVASEALAERELARLYPRAG